MDDFKKFKADIMRRFEEFEGGNGYPTPDDAPSHGDRESYKQKDYGESKGGSDYDKKKAFIAMAKKRFAKEM